jgi:hypothetical protein
MCGKKLLVLSLVLFCSFSVYSQQADITVDELQTLLNERENFKTELAQLKAENKNFKEESMKREQELKLLKMESEIRMSSLEDLKSEMVWSNLGWFISGTLAGYSLNELKNDLIAPP